MRKSFGFLAGSVLVLASAAVLAVTVVAVKPKAASADSSCTVACCDSTPCQAEYGETGQCWNPGTPSSYCYQYTCPAGSVVCYSNFGYNVCEEGDSCGPYNTPTSTAAASSPSTVATSTAGTGGAPVCDVDSDCPAHEYCESGGTPRASCASYACSGNGDCPSGDQCFEGGTAHAYCSPVSGGIAYLGGVTTNVADALSSLPASDLQSCSASNTSLSAIQACENEYVAQAQALGYGVSCSNPSVTQICPTGECTYYSPTCILNGTGVLGTVNNFVDNPLYTVGNVGGSAKWNSQQDCMLNQSCASASSFNSYCSIVNGYAGEPGASASVAAGPSSGSSAPAVPTMQQCKSGAYPAVSGNQSGGSPGTTNGGTSGGTTNGIGDATGSGGSTASLTTGIESAITAYRAANPITAPAPGASTVSFTANGSTNITVAPGASIGYAWSSSGAIATSSYVIDGGSGGDACGGGRPAGPYAWVAATPNGSVTDTVQACQAGHTYEITFTATSASGVATSKTIVVGVSGSGTPVSSPVVVGPVTVQQQLIDLQGTLQGLSTTAGNGSLSPALMAAIEEIITAVGNLLKTLAANS